MSAVRRTQEKRIVSSIQSLLSAEPFSPSEFTLSTWEASFPQWPDLSPGGPAEGEEDDDVAEESLEDETNHHEAPGLQGRHLWVWPQSPCQMTMPPPSWFGVSWITALKIPIWQRNTVTRREVREG